MNKPNAEELINIIIDSHREICEMNNWFWREPNEQDIKDINEATFGFIAEIVNDKFITHK